MSIIVEICEGPLRPADEPRVNGAGAVVCFSGVVRPQETGLPITGLDYEVYEPMATQMLRGLASRAMRKFGLLAVHVEHSRGHVEAGACSFRLHIASAHRAAALEAAGWFIDRLKQDVPIWKRPIHCDHGEMVSR